MKSSDGKRNPDAIGKVAKQDLHIAVEHSLNWKDFNRLCKTLKGILTVSECFDLYSSEIRSRVESDINEWVDMGLEDVIDPVAEIEWINLEIERELEIGRFISDSISYLNGTRTDHS